MCNKLPIIQSNLPLGLIHSPHVPSNVGIHRRFWPCFNRKIHWKGVSTIRFSQKCDIFGWSQSTMKIYYINIRSEKLSFKKRMIVSWSKIPKSVHGFCPKNHPLHCGAPFLQISKKKHGANWDLSRVFLRPWPQSKKTSPWAIFTVLHALFFSARNPKENTLPETDVWKHLKVGAWKTIRLPFWGKGRPIFRGEMAVSFREGKRVCWLLEG